MYSSVIMLNPGAKKSEASVRGEGKDPGITEPGVDSQ